MILERKEEKKEKKFATSSTSHGATKFSRNYAHESELILRPCVAQTEVLYETKCSVNYTTHKSTFVRSRPYLFILTDV